MGGLAGHVGTLAVVGAAGHVLTGPIVHFARGNVGRGFGSLALNLGLSLGAGMIGLQVAKGRGGTACAQGENWGSNIGCTAATNFDGFFGGSAVGFAAAGVVDVAALAYDRPRRSGAWARPTLAPGRVGLAIGSSF